MKINNTVYKNEVSRELLKSHFKDIVLVSDSKISNPKVTYRLFIGRDNPLFGATLKEIIE